MNFEGEQARSGDQRSHAKSTHYPNFSQYRNSPVRNTNHSNYFTSNQESYVFKQKNSYYSKETPQNSNETYVKAKTCNYKQSNQEYVKNMHIEVLINGSLLIIEKNSDLNNELVFSKIKNFIWDLGPMSKCDRLALFIEVIKDLVKTGVKPLEKGRYEGLLWSFTREIISQGR